MEYCHKVMPSAEFWNNARLYRPCPPKACRRALFHHSSTEDFPEWPHFLIDDAGLNNLKDIFLFARQMKESDEVAVCCLPGFGNFKNKAFASAFSRQ
jgi:hypothetical protein